MYSLVEISILNAITAGVMALLVILVARFLKRPAILHALWVVVLLKLVTPPIIEIPVGFRWEHLASSTESHKPPANVVARSESAPRTAAATPVIAFAESGDVTQPPAIDDQRVANALAPSHANAVETSCELSDRVSCLLPILVWTWIVGTIAWFLIQSWRIAVFARFVSTGEPAADDMQRQAQTIAATMGFRRAPRIWVVKATITPLLWSFGRRARVIFPADLLKRVDREARGTLLAHELAHYHRRDHWVRFLEFVVTGLFWWHPAVWLARYQIELVEEQCCDAWVVGQFPKQPRRYAEALLDTIDFLSETRPRVVPAASGLGQAAFLRKRIRTIMSGVAPKSMSGTTRLTVLATAVVLLPLGPRLFQAAIPGGGAAFAARSTQMTNSLTRPPDHSDETKAANTAATISASAVENAGQLTAMPTGESAFWAVVNSADGRFQAMATTDHGLTLRDTFQQRTIDLSSYAISSIAFIRHRDLIAAGSTDAQVYLFDCASGEVVASFAGHRAPVESVAVSLDGRFVASGSHDGVVKLWDVDNETEVNIRVPAQTSRVTCVRFSPDGRLLAIACGDWKAFDSGAVTLWDLRGGSIKQRLTTPAPAGALTFSSRQLIVAEWNGRAMSLDLESGIASPVSDIDKNSVAIAAFAGDASLLSPAAGSSDDPSTAVPTWFQNMDRDHDGMLAWNEFKGPRGTFRKLDADADGVLSWKDNGNIQ